MLLVDCLLQKNLSTTKLAYRIEGQKRKKKRKCDKEDGIFEMKHCGI